MQRTKDIYYIDAIERTSAHKLNVNDLVYLFDNFPEMERIVSIRCTSAKERYIHFQENYDDSYPRIPLGITPETIGKIRAKK
jgi:hypothetical protein